MYNPLACSWYRHSNNKGLLPGPARGNAAPMFQITPAPCYSPFYYIRQLPPGISWRCHCWLLVSQTCFYNQQQLSATQLKARIIDDVVFETFCKDTVIL